MHIDRDEFSRLIGEHSGQISPALAEQLNLVADSCVLDYRSHPDRDDLRADALLAMLEILQGRVLDPEANPAGYLYRVGLNAAKTALKERTSYQHLVRSYALTSVAEDFFQDGDQLDHELLSPARGQLPPTDDPRPAEHPLIAPTRKRQVSCYYYLQDHPESSLAELSEHLECKPRTARYALAKLNQALTSSGRPPLRLGPSSGL